MTKVDAEWHVTLNATCPKCKCNVDLMNISEQKEIDPIELPEIYKEDYDCNHLVKCNMCEYEFIVNEIS